MSQLPLVISTGDPAGVGPSVSLEAARELDEPICFVGDANRLREAWTGGGEAEFIHVADWDDTMVQARAPTEAGGAAQLASLSRAFEEVHAGRARGMVTAPVSKEAVTMAGTRFTGQTEYLAERAGLPRDAVTMLFIGPVLSVGLVTTHLPIAEVSSAITKSRVKRSVSHLAEVLWLLQRRDPICVTGLNPHAGEGGLLGHEELETIAPALDELRSEGLSLVGPRPAEAAFREAQSGAYSGVVAMFHDQATIASKLLDWGSAVNTTWGLPFVRTSVDHGVAYDAAAKGSADAGGMLAALRLGAQLTRDVR